MTSAREQMIADPVRLAAVRATALLDTPAEAAFDRLTRLAATILKAPIALVSLVDQNRDFWIACIGVPEPFATDRQTDHAPSFCQHAILSAAPLVVRDATLEPNFANFPAVQRLGVRAYLGIPLVTDRGDALGSFCVLDLEPRDWTTEHISLLTDLAAAAMTEIELRAATSVATNLATQLQAQALELEQQVEQGRIVSEQLKARTAEAEEANRIKGAFLADMSHELRTPLNAISGHVQLIEMGIHGPVTDKQLEALNRVMRAQHHLLGLINDVLNFAKLESGKVAYNVEPVMLKDVICDLNAMIEIQIAAKGLTYEVRLPGNETRVSADRDKLLQVLLNLLSNAMKFTASGGHITVEVVDRADGSYVPGVVFLRITDTGVGIPRDKLESVFEPFVQVSDSSAMRRQGTGLGLAISRDLARGMSGDLRARSALGVGTTFTLSLRREAEGSRALLERRNRDERREQERRSGEEGREDDPEVTEADNS